MNKIKQTREAAGLSQTELASRAGVSQRYIAFIESGKRKPSLSLAHKISKVLKLSVDELFFAI